MINMARPNGSRKVRGWIITPKVAEKAGVSLTKELSKEDTEKLLQAKKADIAEKKAGERKVANGNKAPSIKELKSEILKAFDVATVKELKEDAQFKLATAGMKVNFSKKESLLPIYREWVKVPMNERNEKGPTAINGIDVLKNFRPWHVFQLDPKTATVQDIKNTYRSLAKKHHPDAGGDRRVFEKLGKMRDSLLFSRK